MGEIQFVPHGYLQQPEIGQTAWNEDFQGSRSLDSCQLRL